MPVLRVLAAALVTLACGAPRPGAQDTVASVDTGALARARREGAGRIERRAAWLREARPCEPPAPVNTAGWRAPLLPTGHEATGVLLPPDFTPDTAAHFVPHAGSRWRAPGGRTFTYAHWFWGPPDADSVPGCRLQLGARPYVVAVERDSARVAVTAFLADAAWAEADGVSAQSPRAADLPLLWTMIRASAR